MTTPARRGKSKPRGTVSTAQAAELLGVHPETVRRWIRGGDLEATGGGGVPYAITTTAINNLLARWEVAK